MLRLPPRPTFFPYTTLFRSGLDGFVRPVRVLRRSELAFRTAAPERGEAAFEVERRAHALQRQPQLHQRDREDRKSTRLNSSYSSISYAVFCLKKKTNIISKD